MKKFLTGFMLTVICLVFPMGAAFGEGTDTTKVVVHYHPLEGDTTNWTLWVWGEGGEGARFPFTSVDENGVKIAEIELQGQFDKVGFIVSTEDWIKDGGDQFVDIVNGVGEAHIIGGQSSANEGSGNMPMLWLIVGVVLVVIFITIMEQLRRRRIAAA